MARGAGGDARFDPAVVAEPIDPIRKLADRFKTAQRGLTEAGKALELLSEALAAMRAEFPDLIDDLHREIARVDACRRGRITRRGLEKALTSAQRAHSSRGAMLSPASVKDQRRCAAAPQAAAPSRGPGSPHPNGSQGGSVV